MEWFATTRNNERGAGAHSVVIGKELIQIHIYNILQL
jgi:hypothetical protein